MQSGKIECRVYSKAKFHAKAYITHGRLAVIGSRALVGSSNFTVPGLSQNVELNVQIRTEVEKLQDWFEHYWEDAQDVTPEMVRVIGRHTREFSPFEVYARALQGYFRGHEETVTEWERTPSRRSGRSSISISARDIRPSRRSATPTTEPSSAMASGSGRRSLA